MTPKNFHESFVEDEIPLPSDRSTGLVFAGASAIIAILWRSNATVFLSAAAIALVFLAVALLMPHVLRPLNIAWMKFALLLNKIVSPLVMFILFAAVIVPFGAIMQLRSDPLRKRRDSNQQSFWVERNPANSEGSMSNQF